MKKPDDGQERKKPPAPGPPGYLANCVLCWWLRLLHLGVFNGEGLRHTTNRGQYAEAVPHHAEHGAYDTDGSRANADGADTPWESFQLPDERLA
jgi:hypothetical protein